jgi:eukaryotic-like serine/threonine-protein kinase
MVNAMPADKLFARIADNPNLPSPPAVALQVLEKVNDLSCTVQDLGKIISRDPALTSKILRLVNSALYSVSQPITSINRAVSLLGMKRVRALVLSLSLPAITGNRLTAQRMQEYWRVSVASSIVAQELARLRGSPEVEDELVAGLLCDLGILALHVLFPQEYAAVLHRPAKVLLYEQCEMERRLFGHDHAEVSAFMLKRWHLPAEIHEAVRYHHRPQAVPAGKPQVADRAFHLYFASRIAQLEVVGQQPACLKEVFTLARERFGMSPERLAEFLEPLAAKIDEHAALLDVDIGDAHRLLLAHATETLTRLAAWTVSAPGKKRIGWGRDCNGPRRPCDAPKNSFGKHKRWKRWAGSRAASLMISTIC